MLLLLTLCLVAGASAARSGCVCRDVEDRPFPKASIYFRDNRTRCAIMYCDRGCTPVVLLPLCDVEGVCSSFLECPDVMLADPTFCITRLGEKGVYCPTAVNDSSHASHPQTTYPGLSRRQLRDILYSALPDTAKSFLLSRPAVTADGTSAVEIAIKLTLQNTDPGTLREIVFRAQSKVRSQISTEKELVASNQLPANISSTSVFNLNFRTSAEAQQQALEALEQQFTASILISKHLVYSTTTDQPSTIRPTRPFETQPTRPTTAPTTTTHRPSKSTVLTTRPDHQYTKPTTTIPPTFPWITEFTRPRPSSTWPTGTRPPRTLPPRTRPPRYPARLVVDTTLTGDQLGPGDQFCRSALPVCDSGAIYRAVDGRCNNLVHPDWGRTLTPVRRLFPNTYADGLFAPTSSPFLPGPRLISEKVMDADTGPSNLRTLSVMSWGQFVDHDLVHSPIFQLPRNLGIECCLPSSTSPPPPVPVHPQCLPIGIRQGDAFYDPHSQRCMNFVRSIPAPGVGCQLGPANQLNDITHWLDGSQIYGSDQSRQNSLRLMSGGRLRTSRGNLLPLEKPTIGGGGGAGYGTSCQGRTCFIAGDSRVNENPILAMYHTIFMREHNRVAEALQNANPELSDEALFQRARRIVVAEFQHISYNEWLPALLGYPWAALTGLRTSYSTYSSIYFPFLNPNIANSFSTAGFRLHSLVRGLVKFFTSSGALSSSNLLRDTFFEPSALLSSAMFARLARSVSMQTPQSFDEHFTSEVRGQLFSTGCFGLDLVSLNIQRGRDHGLAKYTTMLRWCTGIVVSQWNDLLAVMSPQNVERLKTVYTQWDEVDAYAGINLEHPAYGSLVGPTTRCLITEQFLRLRYGDRFFYDLGDQPGSFSPGQLQQIKRASWARLLCDNVGGDYSEVQRYAFFQTIPLNPVVSCASLDQVDLGLF